LPGENTFFAGYRNRVKYLKKILSMLFSALIVLAPAKAGEPAEQNVEASYKAYVKEAVNHYNLAVSYHSKNALLDALHEYRLALDSDNRLVEAWVNMGQIYAGRSPCVELLERAVKKNPQEPTAIVCLGSVYLAQCEYEEAIQQCDRALAVHPNFVSAYSLLAITLKSMDRIEESKAALAKAEEAFKNQGNKPAHLEFPDLSECDSTFQNGSVRHVRDPGTDVDRFQPGMGLQKEHVP
jgi:tetratricopeptide (TPR) repeat protein